MNPAYISPYYTKFVFVCLSLYCRLHKNKIIIIFAFISNSIHIVGIFNISELNSPLFHNTVNVLNLSYIFWCLLMTLTTMLSNNYSKGKSAHINRNDLCQLQSLKEPITPECRSFLFCANERHTHIHTH